MKQAARIIYPALCLFTGFFLGRALGGTIRSYLAGIGIGAFVWIVTFSIERYFERKPLRKLLGGILGLCISLSVTWWLYSLFSKLVLTAYGPGALTVILGATPFKALVVLGAVYTGIRIGAQKLGEISIAGIRGLFKTKTVVEGNKLLDTSVIIDGRIADVCETGFVEGTLIVPQFVLRELQHIADSGDSLKRKRGRRGLDILHKLQKKSDVEVVITDRDFPSTKEVDDKLVLLAKNMNAKVVTNDFNLNKVARLQDVAVLNVNELANAVKPVVLPGETVNVCVVKEGKENNQGVAYLDDGTMVVIEEARRYKGKIVESEVTSILQTTAGRMIFAKMKEPQRDSRQGGKGQTSRVSRSRAN